MGLDLDDFTANYDPFTATPFKMFLGFFFNFYRGKREDEAKWADTSSWAHERKSLTGLQPVVPGPHHLRAQLPPCTVYTWTINCSDGRGDSVTHFWIADVKQFL